MGEELTGLNSLPLGAKPVAWKDGERPLHFIEDVKEFRRYAGKKKGCLIVTNFRIIFTSKLPGFSNTFAEDYAIDLSNIISVSPEKDGSDWRFKTGGFIQSLVFLVPDKDHFDFAKAGIHTFIPEMEELISMRKAELKKIRAQTESQPVPPVRQERPPPPQPILKEREIHVLVKIPCNYCRTLNDQFAAKCVSCGAPAT